MQTPKKQKLYNITLEFAKGLTRTVVARGSSREVAERRALKRNRSAIGVKKEGL